MSVENHKHCQGTVLAATGEPHESGATWSKFSYQNFQNLDALSDRSDWTLPFKVNSNITDDLAVILEMLNNVAGNVLRLREGNLISITNNTVNVRNNISDGYDGLVGITGTGSNRQLNSKQFNIEAYGTGAPLATITCCGVEYTINKLNNEEDNQFYVNFYNGETLVERSGPHTTEVLLQDIKPTDPTKRATAQYTYTFDGWNAKSEYGDRVHDDDKIYKTTNLYAAFSSELRSYSIQFLNWNNDVLQIENVAYGTTPTYNGETPTKEDDEHTYTFSGWDKEIVPVVGSEIYRAQFTEDTTIRIINYKDTSYNTDFTANNSGWHYSNYKGSNNNTRAMKWIGSGFTSGWIQSQGSPGLEEMCSRITSATNPTGVFFYTPGASEKGDVQRGGDLDPMPTSAIVGVGGTAITRLTAKNILITKIQFSPYASGVSNYSTYGGQTSFSISSDNTYVNCDVLGSGSGKQIMGIGNKFQAIMHLKDGTTLPVVNASGNGNVTGNGWRIVSTIPEKQTLEFDFAEVLLGKPIDAKTDYIEFITNPSQVKALVINGLVVKKN